MDRVLIVEDDTDINNFINDYFIIKGVFNCSIIFWNRRIAKVEYR